MHANERPRKKPTKGSFRNGEKKKRHVYAAPAGREKQGPTQTPSHSISGALHPGGGGKRSLILPMLRAIVRGYYGRLTPSC